MVRRPSDMNEYAQQIREYRNQEKGKAYGKVFVKGESSAVGVLDALLICVSSLVGQGRSSSFAS
jgi:hypothetical protein